MKTFCTLLFFSAILGLDSQASSFQCETFYKEIKLTIEDSKISIINTTQGAREIASTITSATVNNSTSVLKVFYKNGEQYKLMIKDRNNFSDSDDTLSIKSPKGHKMTYPVICSK
jgi:hypothetical protein